MRKVFAAAAVSVACSVTAAQAAPVTQPGEQVGLAAGFPLPEGFYAIDTFSVGRSDYRYAPDIGVNIPLIVWSSPYRIFGAHIEPLLAVPSVFVSPHNPAPIPNRDASVFFNPIIGSTFAWNLGGGFGVAYLIGAYLPFGDRGSLGLGFGGTPLVPQDASTTLRQSFFASFVGDGSYNLTAALTYNRTLDPAARYGGLVGAALGPIPNADSLNLDLTATKKFGAFEIGPVAYAYTDLPVNRGNPLYARYQAQGYVAVGGLVGYNFGRFAVQTYVTRQVIARETLNAAGRRQRNEETRGWLRVVVPFPTGGGAVASPAPAPLLHKG
ncbi:transporter [Methylobacterium sp. J-030]|uniref:transporter n=1 Tax=Methylobacterium sp. J-030 TaxID=2836627 RepID=UPI001FB947AA|nr:transporter [Methylobacterium sp. J-030]MCJ2070462.1 transporter [Methylobacterium sp. J-030]